MPKPAQLFLAIAISTLVHAGLFWGGLGWTEGSKPRPWPRRGSPPVTALELHWVDVEGGPRPPSNPPPLTALPPPKPIAKKPAPKATPLASPANASTPDMLLMDTLPPSAKGAPVGVADEVSLAATPPASSGGPPSSTPVEEDNALQQRLQTSAYGCYPARARRQRFEGTTHLAFCVDMQGLATQAHISKSSGYASLDEAALECVVKKAQPLPLSSRGRCFVAPIAFRAGI